MSSARVRLQFRCKEILRYHMMKDEWNREKFSPAPGFEPGFSALRADALSTKPHRIPIPMSNYDDDLFSRLIFSDEATFHTSGKINKHNCRVWGTQTPHRITEHESDSPKVNVFCALSQRKLYGPFFFIEATVTGHSYLNMLEQWTDRLDTATCTHTLLSTDVHIRTDHVRYTFRYLRSVVSCPHSSDSALNGILRTKHNIRYSVSMSSQSTVLCNHLVA
ncbi:hypothetical protein ANN_21089 [Periplaneta americana]|uniref:Transposase n=1 Tax=Periplaneta americana TaxID=6978 RepID=A0ABQ8SF75_PERAM|nr:hypothetical protein ANN_21089 [Periplaneta americana]